MHERRPLQDQEMRTRSAFPIGDGELPRAILMPRPHLCLEASYWLQTAGEQALY